jgi:hypothetical protein
VTHVGSNKRHVVQPVAAWRMIRSSIESITSATSTHLAPNNGRRTLHYTPTGCERHHVADVGQVDRARLSRQFELYREPG